jgi:PAP2 superfamily
MRRLRALLRVDTGPGARGGQPGWSQLPVAVGALAFYEMAHLLTDSQRTRAVQHARELLGFERLLGIDWEHAAQNFSLHSEILRAGANGVYTWLYWPTIVGALVLTWHVDRRHYAILRNGMLLSGAVGLLVFILYPVAPPRMLPQYTDTIAPGSLDHAVVHGSIADSYAALPSFHAGWVALSAVVLAILATRWHPVAGRSLAFVIAVAAIAAMAAAVVVTANHFVLDAVAGVGLALACGVVAYRLHTPSGDLQPTAVGTLREQS